MDGYPSRLYAAGTPIASLRRKAGTTVRFFGRLFFFVVALTSLAVCDSIELRNGHHLQGKYIGGTATMVGFMTNGSVQYFPTSDVLALIFDSSSDLPMDSVQPQSMERDSAQSESGSQLQRLARRKTIRPGVKEQRASARQISD